VKTEAITRHPVSERPSISVALCTYNGQRFVCDQLRSILSQSVPPNEIVICDDGSSDGTVELIENLGSASPAPIRIIRRGPRLGVVKNFEAAVLATYGDVIFLSDQDDVWKPTRIERMIAPFAEDQRIALTYCDAYVVNGDLCGTGQTVFSQRPHLRQPESWALTRIIRGTWIKGCMMAFRRELVPLLVPFPSGWYYDHWIGLMAAANSRLSCIDLPLMEYRRHAANASDDPFGHSVLPRIVRLIRTKHDQNGYRSDVARWQVAADRLTDMLSGKLPSASDDEKTRSLHDAVQKRLDFALMRCHLHAAPRLARIPRVVQYASRGHYHRYVAGWGSVLRDLFCV
jgi:glycosyltransferase involved in cell wall biosynthesis